MLQLSPDKFGGFAKKLGKLSIPSTVKAYEK